MVQTAFQTANKLYSSERSRSASFSVWYLLMNVGAAAGGFSIDVVRKQLELDLTYIFVLGVLTAVASLLVTALYVSRRVPAPLPEVVDEEPAADGKQKTGWEFVVSVVSEAASPLRGTIGGLAGLIKAYAVRAPARPILGTVAGVEAAVPMAAAG